MIKGGYGKKDPPLSLKRSKYTLDPVGLKVLIHTFDHLKVHMNRNDSFLMRYYMNPYLIGKVLRPDPIWACQEQGSTLDIQQALRNKEQYMIYKTIIVKFHLDRTVILLILRTHIYPLSKYNGNVLFHLLRKLFFIFR